MKKLPIIIALLLGLSISFFAGTQWEKLQYNDTCLDLGGRINPGNYPICVVADRTISEDSVDNEIYFDKETKEWKDNYGICHTCTPENGFNADGTTSEDL